MPVTTPLDFHRSSAERFVWRVFVPLIFSIVIVMTIGAAFDRERLLMPDGFTVDTLSGGPPDTGHVTSVVRGSAAERADIRVGDVVRREGLTPGRRALAHAGELYRYVDLRTGRGVTVALRPDPNGWNPAKLFTFAASLVLEFAAFAILVLRPHLLVARALSASVILSLYGTFANLAHWTGSEAIAVAMFVLQRVALGIGIGSLGFVALGLTASIGPKRRILAYVTIVLGVLIALISFARRIIYISTGTGDALGVPQAVVNQGVTLTIVLGFISVASIALQSHGLERRRAVIVAAALLFGNLTQFGQVLHPHFASGAELVVDNIGLLLEAAGLAYAVLVDQLLDIGFVLNRAVVVGAVTALLLPAFVGIEWAAQKLAESSGRFEGAALSLALTIAIALSVRRLHAWVDRVVDALLFASRHRAANAVKRFADEVALFREPQALVNGLLDTLVTFTRIERCEILLADHDDELITAAARGLSVAILSADDPVAIRLKSSRSWLERSTYPLLTQADLAFPMIVRGRLIGALLCGLPGRAEPLSPEEFDAIAHLMREAAATLVAMDAADAHRLREENLAMQARLALHT